MTPHPSPTLDPRALGPTVPARHVDRTCPVRLAVFEPRSRAAHGPYIGRIRREEGSEWSTSVRRREREARTCRRMGVDAVGTSPDGSLSGPRRSGPDKAPGGPVRAQGPSEGTPRVPTRTNSAPGVCGRGRRRRSVRSVVVSVHVRGRPRYRVTNRPTPKEGRGPRPWSDREGSGTMYGPEYGGPDGPRAGLGHNG